MNVYINIIGEERMRTVSFVYVERFYKTDESQKGEVLASEWVAGPLCRC